jgi:hypothetical protein
MDQPQQNYNPNPDSSLFGMNLDAQNSYNLRSSGSWARVMGVAGIITGSCFLIFVIIAISRLSSASRYGYRRNSGFGDIFDAYSSGATFGFVILILTAVIFIFGGWFSYQFGNRIIAALKTNHQEGLNSGFAALRNYYALRAITLIIVALLMVLSLANTL